MRNRVYNFVVFILLLALHASAFAQSPQIFSGLAWLNSSQTVTGNWPAIKTNEYYSTAAALDTVYVLEPTSTNYTTAFAWLSGQIVSPTDYISRRIIALKRAGEDASAEMEGLLLYRDSVGGWGINPGFDDGILDTALALQALYSANYSDTTIIYQALNYLTSHQNPDGGWGLIDQSGSQVSNSYYTATVLNTLSLYKTTFSFQTQIANAANYLFSKQNPDGGFGSSPSTVWDTALAFDALVASGTNISAIAPSAINYLTSTQLSDGSWDDDPYSTALALRALASARANLAVTSADIALSKSMPQENETITITATVHNTGFDSASNIIVRFYLGDPAAGGTQIGADQVIAALSVGGTAQASITASFTGTGGKTIFIVADPDNLISETSKADNKASARLWIATAPDLAVFSEDLKPSTNVPASGAAFTLNYSIRNLGESATAGFDIALYDGQPTGTPLQTAHISGLAGLAVRAGVLGVTLTTNGNHTLYLVADPGNLITESTKTNNTGTITVNVGGAQMQADLAVISADITLAPARPTPGQTVQISAKIRNQGSENAFGFSLEFYDGAPEAGGVLIAKQDLSLAAGADQTLTANWTAIIGIHDLYVVLDRANRIIETNEQNNRASVRVMADMVDIQVSANDLSFTPSRPVRGDSTVFTIAIRNTGIKETGAFNAALYDGDPASGGTLLQTYPVSNIPGDGTATVTYVFTAVPKTYRFYVVADTENVVAEMYEDNNLAIRSLTIKGPGETYGPDNAPTAPDLISMLTSGQTLTLSGDVRVAFENSGYAKDADASGFIVFRDKNEDGKYTQGMDEFLGKGKYAFATFSDQPVPEFVLLITQVYSPALYMEGSVYLIEHDGSIAWGPVYLNELMPDTPPASHENAVLATDIDKEGTPEISVRVNEQSVKLDRDGYLKPSRI